MGITQLLLVSFRFVKAENVEYFSYTQAREILITDLDSR